VCCAVSCTFALLNDEPAPDGLLPEHGCMIWQAPGVALVPETVWMPGQSATEELMANAKRVGGLLAQAYNFTWGEPEQPREDEYAAGHELTEQVYLLDTAIATDRLGRYYSNYQTWVKLGGSGDYPAVSEDALHADFAVVYGAADGLFELYFAYDAMGQLRLIHVINYDYFSA
jgi:hypothetical protein